MEFEPARFFVIHFQFRAMCFRCPLRYSAIGKLSFVFKVAIHPSNLFKLVWTCSNLSKNEIKGVSDLERAFDALHGTVKGKAFMTALLLQSFIPEMTALF